MATTHETQSPLPEPVRTLTHRDHDQILSEIASTTLPSPLRSLANTYEQLVGERDDFIWKWVYTSVYPVTLSCVPPEYEEAAVTAKTMAAMFSGVLDDFAEQTDDTHLLREVSKLPISGTSVDEAVLESDSGHIQFVQRVWEQLEQELEQAPRADEFRSLFEFDMEQVTNGMIYSHHVNQRVEIANLTEGLAYDSHNVQHYPNLDIDLMYSPGFECTDLAVLRRLVWEGQQMHRISNWVCTWERELADGDFTSGVFALALEQGSVSPEELVSAEHSQHDQQTVRRQIAADGIEDQLVDRWTDTCLRGFDIAMEAEPQSVDLVAYLRGVVEVCVNCFAVRD